MIHRFQYPRRYIVTVKHDKGTTRIETTATTKKNAAENVMRFEGCPRRAIVSVTPVKSL